MSQRFTGKAAKGAVSPLEPRADHHAQNFPDGTTGQAVKRRRQRHAIEGTGSRVSAVLMYGIVVMMIHSFSLRLKGRRRCSMATKSNAGEVQDDKMQKQDDDNDSIHIVA